MTCGAQGDEVFFEVIPALAAKFPVMNFEIRSSAARLAPPAVASQDLLSQLVVFLGIKP